MNKEDELKVCIDFNLKVANIICIAGIAGLTPLLTLQSLFTESLGISSEGWYLYVFFIGVLIILWALYYVLNADRAYRQLMSIKQKDEKFS